MNNNNNMLPDFACKFFWDVETAKLDTGRDYRFILERLLEYGDDRTLKWLMCSYSDEQRLKVIKNSRKISRKTASLWQNYYKLSREEIKCFQISCLEKGNVFWNY